MSLNRIPWIVPVLVVLVAVALYFGVVLSRPSIDQPELLGSWTLYASIFVICAAVALVIYRSLRRSRADMADPRTKQR
jgi:fumarate reductase subunit D